MSAQPVGERYLELLKRVLLRYGFDDYVPASPAVPWRRRAVRLLNAALAPFGLTVARRSSVDLERRATGREWPPPPGVETMIGLARLDNLHFAVRTVVEEAVRGDFIETGVWRGGASIFMRAALEAYGDPDRLVWLADSFRGLPEPDPERYPADAGDQHFLWTELAVSADQVRDNFRRYALLDDRVRFLEGWFRDTLPSAPIEHLAILRLDGDLYESTMDALVPLYDRVSPGGFVIVDDYGAVPACRRAIEDFRKDRGITEAIVDIDGTGVFWRKQ